MTFVSPTRAPFNSTTGEVEDAPINMGHVASFRRCSGYHSNRETYHGIRFNLSNGLTLEWHFATLEDREIDWGSLMALCTMRHQQSQRVVSCRPLPSPRKKGNK